jgi:hypothetical protein
MNTRAATIVAAMIASILSSANLAAAPEETEPAAEPATEPCLTSPRDYTPPGTRWRYRIERSTGRHCWFLKDEVEKGARKAPEQVTADAEEPVAATPRRKPAAPRALSDARAELSQTPVEQDVIRPAPAVGASAPAPVAERNQTTAKSANMLAQAPAARWPDSTTAANSASNPPPAPAEQSAEVQSAPTTPPAKPQVMPRAVPPMPASEKPLSLPMLITIVAGGLSVLGVIVSMLLAWRASRIARMSPGIPLPPLETPDQPRRPGDLYRQRKRMRAQKSGRRAA